MADQQLDTVDEPYLVEARLAEEEANRMERISSLGMTLERLASEQVSLRQNVEDRWIEDIRQYHGRYDPETEAKLREDKTKSRVFVNVTRSKTHAAEARLGDLLLPTGEKNWAIKETPVPKLAMLAATVPQGDPEAQQFVDNELKQAKVKAEAMEREIHDQLAEARYEAKNRMVIHDACLLGTGIIKGPVIVGKTRRSWTKMEDPETKEMVRVLEMVDELRPDVERVNPWNFFPDMSASELSEAEFVFERSYMTKKQVRELRKRPGFMPEAVKALMGKDPKEFRIDTYHMERIREAANESDFGINDDRRYEIWTYHGPLEASDLEACGCNDLDPDDVYDAVVTFCGSIVLKAQINVMETGDFPYSVFNWEEDEASIFGYGVPYRLRNAQRVINASWRMTLENAGLSTGPQVVINRTNVEPANGSWELTPRKVWYTTDKNTPVGNTFATFDINSHQSELMSIFQIAKALADEETNLPQIAQGDMIKGQGNQSMQMALNYANVMLRRAVKQYDDNITVPTITRFYDWNMQFSENEDIKGDYEIIARGATVLMEREVQVQHLMGWLSLSASSAHARAIKSNNLLKALAKYQSMRDLDIVKSDQEMQAEEERAAQNQPKDPAVQKAEIELQIIDRKMQYTKQMNDDRLRMKQAEMMEVRMAKQAEREIQVMKMMEDGYWTGEKIKAELAKVAMKTESSQQREIMDMIEQEEEFDQQP